MKIHLRQEHYNMNTAKQVLSLYIEPYDWCCINYTPSDDSWKWTFWYGFTSPPNAVSWLPEAVPDHVKKITNGGFKTRKEAEMHFIAQCDKIREENPVVEENKDES